MTKTEFLRQIEGVVDADEGTLTGADVLGDIDAWDSLAIMSTLAILDQELGLKIPAARIYECRTVDDLTSLAGERLSG